MSSRRESLDPIPRNPSYIFAPADPLLMEHARSWSESKPYLIKGNQTDSPIDESLWISKGTILCLEAVGDGAGKLIKIRAAELPNFLKQ